MFKTVEAEIGPVEVCVFNVGGNVRFPLEETTSRVYYRPRYLLGKGLKQKLSRISIYIWDTVFHPCS